MYSWIVSIFVYRFQDAILTLMIGQQRFGKDFFLFNFRYLRYIFVESVSKSKNQMENRIFWLYL